MSLSAAEGFKSDRFRFVARTITASDEAPTEGEDGEELVGDDEPETGLLF